MKGFVCSVTRSSLFDTGSPGISLNAQAHVHPSLITASDRPDAKAHPPGLERLVQRDVLEVGAVNCMPHAR